jgi:hypothetical protein
MERLSTRLRLMHCSPNPTPLHKGLLRYLKSMSVLFISSLLFLSYSVTAQTSSCWGTQCTSGDFTLQEIYLASDLSGTALTPSSCSTPGASVNVYLAIKIANNTSSDRDGVFLSGTISSDGVSTAYAQCFAGVLPHGGVVTTFVTPTPFVWHCGSPIMMMDAFTGWNSASGPVCTGNCDGAVISKCRTYGNVTIVTPLVANFTSDASCPGGTNYQAILFTSTTTGGTAPYSYTWEINDGTSTTTVGPTSTSTYTYTPTSTHSLTVTLTVTDASDPMQTDSETKNSIVVGSCCVTPTITSQPSNMAVCNGGTATFSVSSTGGFPAPTLQWQEKTPGGSFTNLSNGGVYSGVTTSTLTITGATLAMNGNQYRVILTSGTCTPATSDAATLTVSSNSVTASATPTSIQLASAAHNSQLNAVAGSASNYSWTQDPLSGGSLSSTNIANPVFTATAAGTYKFVVTATQIAAPHCVAKDSVYVDVLASAPGCNLTGPSSTCANTTGLVFDGGSIPSNYSFHWSVNNGASITSAPSDSSSITVTAGSSNFTVTLYITADNPALSPISCPHAVTVNSIPGAPSTTGDHRCGPGVVNLSASGCSGGTLKWYDASSGGNLVNTGSSYSPSLSGSRTFYVSCTSSAGCTGARASVTGTINSIPSAPTANDGSRCGPGIVNLSVSGCSGGTLTWYDAPTGGNVVATGSTYSPDLNATTSYYVSCLSADGCLGSRATVTGHIMDCSLNCTYTQGYYGSTNGNSCDGTNTFGGAVDLIEFLLGVNGTPNPIVIGRNGQSVTIPATVDGAVKLNSVMPGGSTPRALLAGDCLITDACFNSYLTAQGRINNVLFSQTITLTLNSRMNGGVLAAFPVQNGWFTTQKRNGCGSGATLRSCSQDSSAIFSVLMNASVVNYLTNNGANDATVSDLLNLANDLLGGVLIPGQPGANGNIVPLYSSVTNAIDAFNNGFDGCRAFIGYYNCKKSCRNFDMPCPPPIRLGGGDQIAATPVQLKVDVYPNPYNDKVKFSIQSTVSTHAVLEVYNMMGQRVGVLFNGYLNAGEGKTVDYNVPEMNRGNLIYILKSGTQKATGKLIRPN